MVANNNWMVFLSQLIGQSPTLLMYIVGLVLCGVLWRRAPRAAMLAMIGCGLLLATTVSVSFAQIYLITNRGPTAAASLGQIMFALGIGGSILRAAGFGLVLFAVFAERPAVAQQGGFEVEQPVYR